MNQEVRDYLLLHFIVLLWGFTAVIGLLIEIPTVELVFFRTLLSSLLLFAVIRISQISFRVTNRKDSFRIIFVGILFAAHWILFFLSARVSTASICLAGMATTSLWTSFIEPVYFKRKVRLFEVILSVLALLGMVIIFRVELDYVLGLILALGSALCSALFTVINSTVTKRNDHFVITFYEMGIATVVVALSFPYYQLYITGQPLQMTPSLSDWFYIFVLAGVCTVFAYSYSIKLMKRLSAFSINLTVNLEPIYGILLALIILGDSEKMSPGFYLGAALIMVSVLTYPVINRRYKQKELEVDVIR